MRVHPASEGKYAQVIAVGIGRAESLHSALDATKGFSVDQVETLAGIAEKLLDTAKGSGMSAEPLRQLLTNLQTVPRNQWLGLLPKYRPSPALTASVLEAVGQIESLNLGVTLSTQEALALAEAPAEVRRFVLHGAVRAGALFDSNANQGPSSNLLNLGDWRNVEVEGVKERPSFAAYASANLDLGYRLNDGGTVWAVADTSFYWRGNQNPGLDDIHSREWQSGRAAAGIRLLSDRHLLDLRLKGEIFDYEFYNHVAALGPEVRYVFAPLPRLHLLTQANLDRCVYNLNGERNGLYGSVGQYLRVYFGRAGHEFLIGAAYLYGDAEKKVYRHDGWQGTARFTFNLPRGFTVSPFVTFGQEFYQGPATALETRDRKDERWRAGLDLTYALNESWSIEAGYAYTRNDSRSELYTYDQHVASLGVAWKF